MSGDHGNIVDKDRPIRARPAICLRQDDLCNHPIDVPLLWRYGVVAQRLGTETWWTERNLSTMGARNASSAHETLRYGPKRRCVKQRLNGLLLAKAWADLKSTVTVARLAFPLLASIRP